MNILDSFLQKSKGLNMSQKNMEYDVSQPNIPDENLASSSAIIYQSELDYISRCILDYPNLETGGQLFGFWTNTGTPIVAYAIGPGIDAQHNPTSFYQDIKYLTSIGKYLGNQFGLQHVGEWHSHHQLDLAHPSGGDVRSMQGGLSTPGFPRMLLCIGNCFSGKTEINAFNFHKNSPQKYLHAEWNILEPESPYRPLVDCSLRKKLMHPHTKCACHGRIYSRTTLVCEKRMTAPKIHWLTQKEENVQIMKEFVTKIHQIVTDKDVKTLINEEGVPYISINSGKIEIFFPYGFPTISPQLKKDGEYLIPKIEWKTNHENLVLDFEAWINGCLYINENKSSNKCGFTKTSQEPEICSEAILIKQNRFNERFSLEDKILASHIPSELYTFKDLETGEPSLEIDAFPQKGEYIFHFDLKGFPLDKPEVYIKGILKDIHGNKLNSNSVSYCNKPTYSEWTQLNLFQYNNWDSQYSLFRLYLTGCVWVLCYQKALKENEDIDMHIRSMMTPDGTLIKNLERIKDYIINSYKKYDGSKQIKYGANGIR